MMPEKGVRMMTTLSFPPHLDTPGRIAQKLGVPTHRIQYIVATRKIKPAAYAGRLRLFDRNALARIRHELNAIAARRADLSGGAA